MIFSGFCGLKFCSVLVTRAESFLIKFKGAATTLATGTYGSRVRTIFTGACAAEALSARPADPARALLPEFKRAQQILLGRLRHTLHKSQNWLKYAQQILLRRAFVAWFGCSAQISSLRRGSKAQIFSARRGGTTGAISSRYDRAASISSAKFLKFSRAMYRKNAAYAPSARRRRSGSIFQNFNSLEFKRSENFRGFKFGSNLIGSALWSR